MCLAEFAAGVELGHDDLGSGHPFALMDIGRDSAPIIAHAAGAIRIEGNQHLLRKARERLVNGVVDDLVHHVVQAGAVVRVPDIHARPLAHGIEAFEHLDRFRPVIGGNRVGLAGGFSHGGAFESGAKRQPG